MKTGYCGNVHPGRTIEEVKQNLIAYSLEVKRQISPDHPMGIGLWLSSTAAQELNSDFAQDELRDWLADVGLVPFTFNGFPFGDFHQEVVKHDVYLPTWAEQSRLDYTVGLAEIQDRLLEAGTEATISTLPLGWPVSKGLADDRDFMESCARNLRACARRLDRIRSESGRQVTVCIEPEPGCLLDTCDDITKFFRQYLLTGNAAADEMILNHIGVCHDVCHSAVMFEDQTTAINTYNEAGIKVGKVQVSSAIKVNFEGKSSEEKNEILSQLSSFAEPRYLHQTSVRVDGQTEFYEDLTIALAAANNVPEGEWRVHFHVPIFAEQLGLIDTTQDDISKCVNAIRTDSNSKDQMVTDHFEIETYAWNVLPDNLREGALADGIAKELRWFHDQFVEAS